MMTLMVMALVVFLSALLQTVLPSFALLGHVKFPFLVSVVIYYALYRGGIPMMGSAFAAGITQDILTPMMPPGYSVICFLCIGVILGLFRDIVLTESIFTWGILGGAATAVYMLLMYILLSRSGLIECPLRRGLLKVAGSGLLGCVCAPAIFLFASRFDSLVGNIELRNRSDAFE